MRLFAALSAVLCAALSAAPAAAQYPARPVRLVLSTPAGGPSDTAARALAQSLAKSLGQPVIVENKLGANGAIAVQAVMAAPPDGYTLLWGIASMATLPLACDLTFAFGCTPVPQVNEDASPWTLIDG